jgi:hypothetical protein
LSLHFLLLHWNGCRNIYLIYLFTCTVSSCFYLIQKRRHHYGFNSLQSHRCRVPLFLVKLDFPIFFCDVLYKPFYNEYIALLDCLVKNFINIYLAILICSRLILCYYFWSDQNLYIFIYLQNNRSVVYFGIQHVI